MTKDLILSQIGHGSHRHPNHLAKLASFSQVNTKQFLVLLSVFQKMFVFTFTQNFNFSGRGDTTICFCCGISIHQWLSSDNVWREHARWSPTCVFVRYIRGPAFVRKSGRLGYLQNSDEEEELLYAL